MRKFLFFSVALLTTTLLCASCQKDDVAVTSDVSTAVKSDVQTGKNLHVSYKDAIQIATDAVAMLEGGATTRSDVKRRVDLSKVMYHITPQTRSGEGSDTLYYVVNYADSAGFALVSTSRANGDPLIAVTEQGNYTPGEETGNPGFDMYIDLLNNRIDNGVPEIDPEFPGFGPFYETIVLEESEVEPMLVVKWGQGEPYNDYCTNGYAGCAAIALAQIMSYHQHPTSFTRTHDGTNSMQMLHWAGIKSYPQINDCSINNQDALAHLIKEIGVNIKMKYFEDGSYAMINDVKNGLISLGYSANATINNYNFNLISSELDNNRPVYMRGESIEGHAWVVDGYYSYLAEITEYYEMERGGERIITNVTATSTNHLHINWGYDGIGNGYYQSNIIDPSNYVQLDNGETALAGSAYDSTTLQILVGLTPNF